MTLIRVLVLTFLALSIAASLLAADNPPMQARVYFDTKDAWAKLRSLHLDQVRQGPGYIEIITFSADLENIAALGFRTEVVHPDLPSYFRSRLPDKAMGAYKTLDEIYAYLDQIIATYPSIVSQKVDIGQTYEGRDLWAVKISDNPNLDEDEPEVFYGAAIHAREVITPEILFYFMDYLTQNYGSDPDVTDLVNGRELWFVIVINPDGYYRNEVIAPNGGGMWRKNRRINGDGTFGVDLNRNFGYAWGFDNYGSSPLPSSETYRGIAPFSEPETQALRYFIENRHFVLSVYFHAYGNLVLWPWGYDRLYTTDEDIFAAIGDSISDMNGYTPGPGWTLYVTNGESDDWGYGEQTTKNKIFSITIEVGDNDDNFWPASSRIQQLVSENLGPNLFLARVAGRVHALRPPSTPIMFVADTVDITSYTVSWSHDDTLNPAVAFELTELSDYEAITDAADAFTVWANRDFTLSTARYSSAPTSFYSGIADNSIRYIQSMYPYRVQPGDSLRFQAYFNIETDWDYAYVEISTNGVDFAPIPGNITTEANPNGSNRGHGITGVSGGWVNGRFALSDFVGRDIYVRFSYYTDQYFTEEGLYLDDIFPVGAYRIRNTISPIFGVDYTFTDKLEGEYVYQVRAQDAQLQWSAYSNMATTYATELYVCGDASGDNQVNIADAVYDVNYIFRGGPAPNPMAAGDANSDGEVNLADAVYIINYIFKGGPVPICP